jgi:hypothetical protein
MWNQSKFSAYSAQALSPRKIRSTRSEDEHAHSPHRPDFKAKYENESTAIPLSLQGAMPPPPLPANGRGLNASQYAKNDTIGTLSAWHDFDPFFDHNSPTRRQGPASTIHGSSDTSMPDYSRSVTPGSSVSVIGQNLGYRTGDAANDQMIGGILGLAEFRRDVNSGTLAPANTRRSSVASAAGVAPTMAKSSAAAEARKLSYPSRDNRQVSEVEYHTSMKGHHRNPSNISLVSDTGSQKENTNPTIVIHSDDIKSKKERKAANKTNEVAVLQQILQPDSNESKPKMKRTGSKSSLKVDSGSKRKRDVSLEDVADSTSANNSPSLRVPKGDQGEDTSRVGQQQVHCVHKDAAIAKKTI